MIVFLLCCLEAFDARSMITNVADERIALKSQASAVFSVRNDRERSLAGSCSAALTEGPGEDQKIA